MQNILIIGLGRFGKHLAVKMKNEGCDIMAVEADESKAQSVLEDIRNVMIADAREETIIRSLDVDSYDMCVVAISDDFQTALEVTVLLKDFGARYILARAETEVHRKLLLRNGADKVICTDLEMAERLAFTYAFDNVYDYIRLTGDMSIYEIETPKSWLGHKFSEHSLYEKYDLSILATKQEDADTLIPEPSNDYIFNEGDHLVVLGTDNNLRKLI